MNSRAGNVVPRPLGKILHGTKIGEVFHFDYLKLEDNDDGYTYVLVLVDDVSSFASLQTVASCTSDGAARSILEWVTVLGIPEMSVSDGAPHSKNETLKLLMRNWKHRIVFRWRIRRRAMILWSESSWRWFGRFGRL